MTSQHILPGVSQRNVVVRLSVRRHKTMACALHPSSPFLQWKQQSRMADDDDSLIILGSHTLLLLQALRPLALYPDI